MLFLTDRRTLWLGFEESDNFISLAFGFELLRIFSGSSCHRKKEEGRTRFFLVLEGPPKKRNTINFLVLGLPLDVIEKEKPRHF